MLVVTKAILYYEKPLDLIPLAVIRCRYILQEG